MFRRVLVGVCWLSLGAFSIGAETLESWPTKASAVFVERTLTLTSDEATLELIDFLEERWDEAEVSFVTLENDTWILVYTAAGWSRSGAPRDGYCGTGREVILEWVTFGLDGSPQESERILFESCFKDRWGAFHGWSESGTARWTATRWNFDQDTFEDFEIQFSSNAPEVGFQTARVLKEQ